MPDGVWEFAIDVGGTFCDVIGRDPQGRILTHKLLSSGRTKGTAATLEIADCGLRIADSRRQHDPEGFWEGYRCVLLDSAGRVRHQSRVRHFDAATGTLELETGASWALDPGTPYELFSDEEAPVVAIRYLMRLRRDDSIGPCDVRLGTTLATNALLERRGAPTAVVTTEGFADLLLIGDQTRPKLFELNIKKPRPLHEITIELRERIDSEGQVLTPLDSRDASAKLTALKENGINSVAVCLMNAYRNPVHERQVARLALEAGFEHVAVSSSLSPTQGMLNRAQNCVVDAYLGPVFRKYLSSIQARLPQCTLRLMTGAGGLVGAERFSGNAGILSGPAGGLVGCARVAQSAGFKKVIAFDMGGTSTDVSRFDGQFEYQYETQKAGFTIVTPVLAIETIAAGGGSICRFDGYRFQVGPHSAGTDPGPACYGRGGPLTLTDANLHLGKIRTGHFPFPLDPEAVTRRLEELALGMAQAHGMRPVGFDQIAEGFVQIANAKMAAAIKRITIERGIDARDYALVSFGGAGAQHACAVARLLGISRILLPPLAGVLSAYGIASADRKHLAQRPVHRVYDAKLDWALQSLFEEMEVESGDQLRAEGVAPERIRCTRFLDLRYAGAGAPLTVSVEGGRSSHLYYGTRICNADPHAERKRGESRPVADAPRSDQHRTIAHPDIVKRFENQHRRRFGYVHADRDIEIVNARVEAIGLTNKPIVEAMDTADCTASPVETAPVVFDGRRIDTAVLDGSALGPAAAFDGPAIVAQATTTIIVDPGWQATVTATGDIIMTDSAGAVSDQSGSTEVDPVRLELFNNHFAAIAEQMGTALCRTALSTNVKERLDFSCAVFDADGELIANAPHIPVHLGSMGACVQSVLADVSDIGPDDVIVTNDPFRGGTHLPDVTVVTPVFIGNEPRFFVASRAHHAEMGGIRPGSMPPDSTSLAQEGVLIRAFKIIDAGRERFDVLRKILTAPPFPSRAPDENIADVVAQIAANKTGRDALHALVGRFSLAVVSAYTQHVRDAAERKMRAAIARLPDGEFHRTERLDDGSAISVHITVAGAQVTVDFTGTAAVLPGNLNANQAIVTSVVLYCFRCLIEEDIPLNAGVLGPIRLITPPSLLNPPPHDDPADCPAVAGGNVETSQRIVDCIFGALQVAAASQGTMNNLSFGNDRLAYYETICGGSGAGPDYDGADAVHTHMTNTRLTDPEVLEARYPIRLRRFMIRRGSGGNGLHRGGDGCIREIEFLETLELSLITQRRTTQPYGLNGGAPGAPGINHLIRTPHPQSPRVAPSSPW